MTSKRACGRTPERLSILVGTLTLFELVFKGYQPSGYFFSKLRAIMERYVDTF